MLMRIIVPVAGPGSTYVPATQKATGSMGRVEVSTGAARLQGS